jgi:hypothetical protein
MIVKKESEKGKFINFVQSPMGTVDLKKWLERRTKSQQASNTLFRSFPIFSITAISEIKTMIYLE